MQVTQTITQDTKVLVQIHLHDFSFFAVPLNILLAFEINKDWQYDFFNEI